jgi:hypothetical protein
MRPPAAVKPPELLGGQTKKRPQGCCPAAFIFALTKDHRGFSPALSFDYCLLQADQGSRESSGYDDDDDQQ